MKKTTKRFLLGAAVAASLTTLGAAYRSSAHSLTKFAIDREEPKSVAKNKERMIDSSELSQIMENLESASQKLKALDCEQVEIQSADGIKLVGHWYFKGNPRRVIIAMHGWRSSWSHDFGLIADFWHNNGCAVLYAEQRGQGNSGGDYMSFGLLERYDCLDWINWVNERTGGAFPIYLNGISMGASTVLMAAGLELPENVHGITADCAFTSPDEIWRHVVENNFHLPYGLYSSVAYDIFKRKLKVDSKSYSCTEAMKKCKVPVLFVHGTDDRFVPIKMTYDNYKACAAPKRLFIVPGAEHGLSYVVDTKGFQSAVKNFWRDCD